MPRLSGALHGNMFQQAACWGGSRALAETKAGPRKSSNIRAQCSSAVTQHSYCSTALWYIDCNRLGHPSWLEAKIAIASLGSLG